MRSSIDACIRTVLPLAIALFLAGCVATTTVARHEARVRDAWQCELEAEEYLRVTQNANDLRYFMIESCMAMRGHQLR